MITNRLTLACGALIAGVLLQTDADAQQRPLSINAWLQAERANANMQRAVEQYERARFGSATAPQPQYRQPQQAYSQQAYSQQAQAPQAAPQQPVQPPAQQPTPLHPDAQPPQPQSGQNTNQVPPDALEKIDKTYGKNATAVAFTPSTGYFVAGSIGWSPVADTTLETGATASEPGSSFFAFQGTGAVGYKPANGISYDVAASYNYADFDDIDGYTSVFGVMPNARMEFDMGQKFMPYVTGGLGLGILSVEDFTDSTITTAVSDSGFVVAYQLGAGVMYPVAHGTALDFGYKFLGTTEADLKLDGTEYTADFASHTFLFGVRHQL